jgi:hypothetical protein
MNKHIKNIMRSLLIVSGLFVFVFGSFVNRYPVSASSFANSDVGTSADASGNDVFAVEMEQTYPETGLTQMVETGVKWIRFNNVKWSEIEPNPGEYDQNALDKLEEQLYNALNAGMNLIIVVRSAPSWAQKYSGYNCGPIAENNIKDFANFMATMVDRYKDYVKYWEIWNEPDAPLNLNDPGFEKDGYFGCWGDANDTTYYGGDYFSQMLSQVYPAIKNVDPEAQVIVGGLMMDCGPNGNCSTSDKNRLKFVDGILDNGKGGNFDGFAFHAYDYYTGGLGNYSNGGWNASRATTGPVELLKADYLRNKLGQYGIVGKYLMNTELALVCDSNCLTNFEITKAYYIAQSYAGAIAKGLRRAVWYGARMGWRNTDLLTLDYQPRTQPYNAYKFGRGKLEGAVYARDITEYNGIMGFEFNLSDRRLWVIWSKDGANHQITLPETPLAIYDVYGEAKTITIQPTIGLMPYYIELTRSFYINVPLLSQNFQPILNSNFERGTQNNNPVSWEITRGPSGEPGLPAGLITTNPTEPQLDTNIPQGNASMQLGLANYACGEVPIGYAGIRQQFTVPYTPGNLPVKITFNYIIYSQDDSTSSQYDGLEVYIHDPGGVGTRQVFRDGHKGSASCSTYYRVPASGWQTGTIDLTSPVDYRGKTVTIEFRNVNQPDNGYNTLSYIDRVYIIYGP